MRHERRERLLAKRLQELRHFRGNEGEHLEAVHLNRAVGGTRESLRRTGEEGKVARIAVAGRDERRRGGIGKEFRRSRRGVLRQTGLDVAIHHEDFLPRIRREPPRQIECVGIGAACHLHVERGSFGRKTEA